jgi:TetR/AcrR family transcriptional regulator, tetracycline repressor protein
MTLECYSNDIREQWQVPTMTEITDRAGREPVIQAGLKLLNQVGLEKLTLKLIAEELGIRAPTLYWRFKNKQELIDEMATRVLGECTRQYREAAARTWRDWALLSGRGLRATLLRYRDGARMVSGSYLTEASAVDDSMEAVLGCFVAAGYTAGDGVECIMTVYSYTIGFTIEEQAVISPQGERDPRYDDSKRRARIDEKSHPLAHAIGPVLFQNYEQRFENGLRMIVAGFAAERAAQ